VNRGGDARGESGRWSDEWREQVTRELESSAEKHQQTAVIQERILNRLQQHDEDIKALEARPAGFRSDLSAYGGCLYMAVALVIAGAEGLISVGGVIIALYVALHR
jgi:hypothetical protein